MGAQESQPQPPVSTEGPIGAAAHPSAEAAGSPPQEAPGTGAPSRDQASAFPPGASERLGAERHTNWPTEQGDDEDEEVRAHRGCPCLADACSAQKERCGACYCCFALTFVAFTVVFPLFLRWLVKSPIPSEYWNEDFPKFPPLENKSFIRHRHGEAYGIEMSEIPDTWSGGNYSCTRGSRSIRETSEMSFPVHMRLDAPDYKHTAYPVLFASSDFKTWRVASDRTDTVSSEFFPTGTRESANVYRHVTEECTRPPELIEEGKPQRLQASDGVLGSLPLYAMVCVSWSLESIRALADKSELSSAEIGQHCQAIGGVCGWPCGSRPRGKQLPACSAAGVISVEAISEQLGGTNFSGEVALEACLQGYGGECTTSATPMSKWPCRQCAVTGIDATVEANKTYQLRYDSLPKMEVVLKNVQLQSTDAVPHAYIVTSTVDPQERGPAALYGSTWRKLYFDHSMLVSDPHLHPKPVPVERLTAKWTPHPVPGVPAPWADGFKPEHFFRRPMRLSSSLNKMQLVEHSKVELQPEQCFASRGPLYLVACAVNQSTHADNFEFVKGQKVAPPPFNDRCITVTGKCAYAGMSQQRPGLHHCGADGFIRQEDLWEDFEAPTNSDEIVVGVICVALMIGFAVKLMTFCPGLFSPYRHPQHYDVMQTGLFQYIAVCVASGSETKACVLRNFVGALSALPVGCECPYHVLFADEGHRHSQKVMFRALAQVIHCVPDSRMTSGRNMEIDVRRMKGNGHYKEGNLKAFTKYWVEATRALTLRDCDTASLKMRAKELGRQAPHDKAAKDEIKRITEVIDRLCGLTALRRLQALGWPSAESSAEVRALEAAVLRLGNELCSGEQEVASDSEGGEAAKPMHLDDCEAYYWQPTSGSAEEEVQRLYTLHYVARARPAEDERTVKTQHVSVGTWYYTIPKEEEHRAEKTWLEWRRNAQEYQGGVPRSDRFVVPLRTSRGKAGALNFCENYLYDCHHGGGKEGSAAKHALLGVADARHQFQPDFFHATIPHFLKQGKREIDSRIAFTQSPQYFPEVSDDVDYLDTNNANFFRLNCMLRNCVGGVSSCGTNCTWLVRDRRAGLSASSDGAWEADGRQCSDFHEKLEHRFFQETCKVEHTASSMDRVVKGKLSRYVNQRLSFGMVKDPTDYLGAVQRWGEGSVVLSMRTFLALGDGAFMLWMSLLLFLAFILSVANIVYGWGYEPLLEEFTRLSGNDMLVRALRSSSDWVADRALDLSVAEVWFRQVFYDTFLEVQIWFLVVLLFTSLLAVTTLASSVLHRCCCLVCGVRPATRFPTTMAQWARLGIALENLTYFLWFWIAFLWVGFNYYAVWSKRWYHFEERGMVFFTYLLQVLGWSLVITASFRYRTEQGLASNEVLFLSLTNVWRTTQLFYITAPLLLYSFLTGMSDFTRSRTANADVSYWSSGDSAASKLIAQCWTLFLIAGAIASWAFFWSSGMPQGSVGGLLIVTFIALDVLQPCAFMWLGNQYEESPKPPPKALPGWQRGPYRFFQLVFSLSCWRNAVRLVVFHPNSTFIVRWLGPLQNILFPALTWVFPELGLNQVLLLLASRSS